MMIYVVILYKSTYSEILSKDLSKEASSKEEFHLHLEETRNFNFKSGMKVERIFRSILFGQRESAQNRG